MAEVNVAILTGPRPSKVSGQRTVPVMMGANIGYTFG